ncbi:hypothetical protein JCM12294_05460 [Desulfocicer niacini]
MAVINKAHQHEADPRHPTYSELSIITINPKQILIIIIIGICFFSRVTYFLLIMLTLDLQVFYADKTGGEDTPELNCCMKADKLGLVITWAIHHD